MSVIRKNGICNTYSARKSRLLTTESSHVMVSREMKIERNHSAAFTNRIWKALVNWVDGIAHMRRMGGMVCLTGMETTSLMAMPAMTA